MKNLVSTAFFIVIVLALGTPSCGSGEDGFSGSDADAISEQIVDQATETPAEGAPDAVSDPDAAEEVADDPGSEVIMDVNQEEEPVRDPRWICVGDNPDRIAGSRNGSEICDDDAFIVTDDRLGTLILACYADDPSRGNGIAYVATNTGPNCTQDQGCCPPDQGVDCPVEEREYNEGNIPRCRGWEQCGCAGQICPCENAWDHLEYASDGLGAIMILECPPEGATRIVDLSAYSGQKMWVGSHTQPDGTGRMTESCISKKTW